MKLFGKDWASESKKIAEDEAPEVSKKALSMPSTSTIQIKEKSTSMSASSVSELANRLVGKRITKLTDQHTVYACVDLISQATSSVKLVARFKGELIPESEAQDMLTEMWPGMTNSDFLYRVTQNLMSEGNAAIRQIKQIGRDSYEPILRHRWNVNVDPKNDRKILNYTIYDKKVKVENCIHIMLPDPDSLTWGMSPLDAAMTIGALDKSNTASIAKHVARGGAPNMIVQSKTTQNNRQQKDTNDKFNQTLKQWGKEGGGVIATDREINLTVLGDTLDVSSLIGVGDTLSRRICMVYSVPPPLLGDLENATLANVNTVKAFFWNHRILPTTMRITGALGLHFRKAYGRDFSVDADVSHVDALLGNYISKIDAAVKMKTGLHVPMEQIDKIFSLGVEPFPGFEQSLVPGGMLPSEQLGIDIGEF